MFKKTIILILSLLLLSLLAGCKDKELYYNDKEIKQIILYNGNGDILRILSATAPIKKFNREILQGEKNKLSDFKPDDFTNGNAAFIVEFKDNTSKSFSLFFDPAEEPSIMIDDDGREIFAIFNQDSYFSEIFRY